MKHDTQIETLGNRLDDAEPRADNCITGDYDFEDANGHLQHREKDCPACRFRAASDDYFDAIRTPVLAARSKLLRTKRPMVKSEDELAALYNVREDARDHYEDLRKTDRALVTERELLDAAAAEELAESNYEITYSRWHDRLEAQKLGREQRTAEKKLGIRRVFPRRRNRSVKE